MTASMPANSDRFVETPNGPLFVRDTTGDDPQCR